MPRWLLVCFDFNILDEHKVAQTIFYLFCFLWCQTDFLTQVAYADEAVKRGSLAVAASNGRDSIALCLERPTTTSADATSSAPAPAPAPALASASASTVTPSAPFASSSATQKAVLHDDDGGVGGEHGGRGRRHKRRRHGGGGVRDPGVGVGIVDSANNQDRKLCEVPTHLESWKIFRLISVSK